MKKSNMGNSNTTVQMRAIVVGSSTDDFVRCTAEVLEDYGVKFICCNDVYSAVVELAKNTDGNVLVIGRLEKLGREHGRFFHLAGSKGIFCCCLADRNLVQMQRHLGPPASAAKQAAVFVTDEPAQIEKEITKLLANNLAASICKKENRLSDLIKDEFLTTQAELDALLGT
jgi:hypothetical protein